MSEWCSSSDVFYSIVFNVEAVEEDHVAVYPEQGPVKCCTVSLIDTDSAGVERYYAVASKYLLQGTPSPVQGLI